MFEWKTEQGINNTFSQTVTQFPFKHQASTVNLRGKVYRILIFVERMHRLLLIGLANNTFFFQILLLLLLLLFSYYLTAISPVCSLRSIPFFAHLFHALVFQICKLPCFRYVTMYLKRRGIGSARVGGRHGDGSCPPFVGLAYVPDLWNIQTCKEARRSIFLHRFCPNSDCTRPDGD